VLALALIATIRYGIDNRARSGWHPRPGTAGLSMQAQFISSLLATACQQKPLDIAHACVRMFYTGTWAPGVDIGPVQEVLGREDVATVIHSCVMRLRRRL